MYSQVKSSYSYKFSMLASSFKFLVIGIVILLGASLYTLTNNAESDIAVVISMAGIIIILCGVIIGCLSIPITLYRLLRYRSIPVQPEYREVVEPVKVEPELTDKDKKARFIDWEKEWIAVKAIHIKKREK